MTNPADPAEDLVRQAEPERLADEVRLIEDGATVVRIPWPKRRPRYVVTVRLRERADEFECVSFTLTSLWPGTSVSTAILRDLPVASLVREAIHTHLDNLLRISEAVLENPPSQMVHVHYGPEGPTSEVGVPDEEFLRRRSAALVASRAEIERRLGQASGKGTGRRYPPGHLEAVARIAREARRRKGSAQAAVAETFGISESAAANQIARARRGGFFEREEI